LFFESNNCAKYWANGSGRPQGPRGLRRGSTTAGSRRGIDVCLVNVVCCQVEIFGTDRSLDQRNPTEYDVSEFNRGKPERGSKLTMATDTLRKRSFTPTDVFKCKTYWHLLIPSELQRNKSSRMHEPRAAFLWNRSADSLDSTEENRPLTPEDLCYVLILERIMEYRHGKSIGSIHLAECDEILI
jgi:hypothetical protein